MALDRLIVLAVFSLTMHFGTGIEHKAGQKLMACGNMMVNVIKNKRSLFCRFLSTLRLSNSAEFK